MWTTWEFRSVEGTDVNRVVRRSVPGEEAYVHEYQRILYRGEVHAAAVDAARFNESKDKQADTPQKKR